MCRSEEEFKDGNDHHLKEIYSVFTSSPCPKNLDIQRKWPYIDELIRVLGEQLRYAHESAYINPIKVESQSVDDRETM